MYTPPQMMNMPIPKFGSLAPNNMQMGMNIANSLRSPQQQPTAMGGGDPSAQPQGMQGILGALTSAMRGQPQAGAPVAPGGGSAAPPQMGMLGAMMQKLGMGGGAQSPAGGTGPTPTALTGMW